MLLVSCCFLFKRTTAYEVRISDWSSDVCSSDLVAFARNRWSRCLGIRMTETKAGRGLPVPPHGAPAAVSGDGATAGRLSPCHLPSFAREIGNASWRDRVCPDV